MLPLVRRLVAAAVPLAFVHQAVPSPADALFARAVAVVQNDARAPYAIYTVVVNVTANGRRVQNAWQTTEDIAHGLVLASSFSEQERANPTTPHGINVVGRRRIQLSPPRSLNPGLDPAANLTLKSNPVNPERNGDIVGPVALAVDQNFGLTPPRAYRIARDERTVADTADELTTIGRTGARVQRYRIGLLDTDGGVAHLELTPLHDPYRNRLRELWVEAETAFVQDAVVQGIGDRAPFDRVRWHVEFARVQGATYLSRAYPVDPLSVGGASPDVEIRFDHLHLLPTSPLQTTFGIEAPVRFLRDP